MKAIKMSDNLDFPVSPIRINLETNPGTCNLSCIMCDIFSVYNKTSTLKKRNRNFLAKELIIKVITELRGTNLKEIVTTSMGEPFLYPHLEELIKQCKENHLQLHITTNGTFPNGGAAKWADLLNGIGADIKISVNGASPFTYEAIMQGSKLSKVLNNVEIYTKIRDRVSKTSGQRSRLTLKCTFMKNNIKELPELVKLAHESGFDRIRGNHLISLYPETDHLELLRDKESVALFNSMVDESIKTARELAQKTGRSIELSQFHKITDTKVFGDCPYIGKEIWIDPSGNVSPCCVPVDYMPKIRFGNIEKSGILSIWNGADYKHFYSNYKKHNKCKTCTKRITYAEIRE